ncbi:glycoside hydrolase family 19 protein [Agrilutibacter solisilvae]|uniref:Glycoside hydrolase family 19 protein n=1 Tax=Agrilutibacter solisilvae TaxID=2763317 RepID=A0A974XZP1_9GAMM|nr:glycoside hydrolase family 19 protein [Lysobacter solisilvae]QSX77883.1 glycoside hydrolase family 19 protein [Lysobacter solisilvae]
MLSPSVLKRLYPRAPQAHLDSFAQRHAALFDEFGVGATRNRLQFFLAQIGHESSGLTIAEENLSYRASRLMAVWPSRFPTLAAAEPFAHNPQKLANQVYAHRMGNGAPESGDGFRFRGRGYAQVTGRDGYREVGAVAGLDLLTHPRQVADPDHALRAACAFWEWKKLSALADRGDFVAVTRRWNGGNVGMEDRRLWLVRVQTIVPTRTAAG